VDCVGVGDGAAVFIMNAASVVGGPLIVEGIIVDDITTWVVVDCIGVGEGALVLEEVQVAEGIVVGDGATWEVDNGVIIV